MTTHRLIKDLARADGTSMQAVLERALEDLRRRRFVEQVNRDYGSLRADRSGWAAEQAERKIWDATLLDGLPRGEYGFVRESTVKVRRRRKRR